MKHSLLKRRLLRTLCAVKTKFTDIRPWSSPNHCIFPQKAQQRHPHVRSVALSALTLLQYARNRLVCRDGRHLTRLLNAAAARHCGWHLESGPSAQQRPAKNLQFRRGVDTSEQRQQQRKGICGKRLQRLQQMLQCLETALQKS